MEKLEIEKITPILAKGEVAFAGIFGSFAKGKETKKSDLDMLIRFKKPQSLLKLIFLERMLSEKVKRKVDLVTEQSLSPYIKNDVLNDLKIIYGAR